MLVLGRLSGRGMLMKKIRALLVLLLFVAPLAMAQNRIVIDGTGDSQQLLRILAKAFEQANPGTEVVVPDSVGSSGGVRSLLKGNSWHGLPGR